MDAERFARQIALPEIGVEGQEVLGRSRVLLMGAGGLGCAAGMYLAAAGVGTLGLVDGDVVELSNLNRQILHRPQRLGLGKAESARRTLQEFNPGLAVEVHARRLTSPEAMASLAGDYHVVVDCLDNFASRYQLNQACQQLRKPWVYGAVAGLEGQVMTVRPGESPCYQCLYPTAPPPSPQPETIGVLGVIAGLVGVVQAAEALKVLLGRGRNLLGCLLYLDLLGMRFQEMRLGRNPACACCGSRPARFAPGLARP